MNKAVKKLYEAYLYWWAWPCCAFLFTLGMYYFVAGIMRYSEINVWIFTIIVAILSPIIIMPEKEKRCVICERARVPAYKVFHTTKDHEYANYIGEPDDKED